MQQKRTPWDSGDGWRLNLPPAPRREVQESGAGGRNAVGRHDVHNGEIVSPMHGQILQISVKPGDTVKRGQALAIVEAMKMEHTILAPSDGIVASIQFAVGDRVEEGVQLMKIETP